MSNTSSKHDDPDPATASRLGYACGRLLALLAAVDANLDHDSPVSPATEAFAAASTNPARAFGPLLMRSLPPLMSAVASKQASETLTALADQLDDVMATLGAQFPTSLSPEGQAAFALGFLQERMTQRHFDPTQGADSGRQDVLIEEEFIDPDDIFPDDL